MHANFTASDDTQKSQRSRHCTHKSTGSSHKLMNRSRSCDLQSKGSMTKGPEVIKFHPSLYFHVQTISFTIVCLVLHMLMHYITFCHSNILLQKIDLSKLEVTALWRYWRHFNLVSWSCKIKSIAS